MQANPAAMCGAEGSIQAAASDRCGGGGESPTARFHNHRSCGQRGGVGGGGCRPIDVQRSLQRPSPAELSPRIYLLSRGITRSCVCDAQRAGGGGPDWTTRLYNC
eukprot:GHVU01214085.1.p4 GENE.GHVU01214085.1~~GHVU01214085.1.p4  ORF type:complete len:105 (+),score=5.91 GHVU01214085.1:228-542(+)